MGIAADQAGGMCRKLEGEAIATRVGWPVATIGPKSRAPPRAKATRVHALGGGGRRDVVVTTVREAMLGGKRGLVGVHLEMNHSDLGDAR